MSFPLKSVPQTVQREADALKRAPHLGHSLGPVEVEEGFSAIMTGVRGGFPSGRLYQPVGISPRGKLAGTKPERPRGEFLTHTFQSEFWRDSLHGSQYALDVFPKIDAKLGCSALDVLPVYGCGKAGVLPFLAYRPHLDVVDGF